VSESFALSDTTQRPQSLNRLLPRLLKSAVSGALDQDGECVQELHVANSTPLLSIARILWAFDIRKAKDATGTDLPIDRDAVVGGLAVAPAPFQ
jgi:hypothetical protein